MDMCTLLHWIHRVVDDIFMNEVCRILPDWQCASSGLVNGLAPIRWQTVSEPLVAYLDDPYMRHAALVCYGA